MKLPPPLRWILRASPVVALVSVAVWALTVQYGETASTPRELDWILARAVVQNGYQPGDVVRIAPSWADQGRSTLFDMTFDLTTEIEDEELYTYDRLWIIADREHAAGAAQSLPEGYTIEDEWRPSDRTTVFLVDIPPQDRVLTDFYLSLGEAVVTLETRADTRLCDVWSNNGWHCDRPNPWVHITAAIDEAGNSLHRCIYVGLPPDESTVENLDDGATFHITWHDIELGRSLEGNVGNIMGAFRSERGSDVQVVVSIDGEQQHRQIVGKWESTFHPYRIETSDLNGTRHTVSFSVYAEEFWDRWMCLRGRVLR